jgi:hypothetical protein
VPHALLWHPCALAALLPAWVEAPPWLAALLQPPVRSSAVPHALLWHPCALAALLPAWVEAPPWLAALLQPLVSSPAVPHALLWHPPSVLLHPRSTAAGVSLRLQKSVGPVRSWWRMLCFLLQYQQEPAVEDCDMEHQC